MWRRVCVCEHVTLLPLNNLSMWLSTKSSGQKFNSWETIKDLYIGSFYMAHHTMKVIQQLEQSLEGLMKNGNMHVSLCGEFNCPDVDWSNYSGHLIQQALADLALTFNLNQTHETPTREDNLLDLVVKMNPSLIKSVVNGPGISDHDIIITDSCT